MSLRVHHIALRARDPDATERFYVSVLGLRVVSRQPARGSVWLDADGVIVMVERAESGERLPAEGTPPGTKDLVAFAVDDLPAWRRRLVEAGVPIEGETPNTLYVRDPDGRRVGVSTYVFQAPGPP
ncbi:MAG TPA: VOC family protein [Polyangiaceae bacterium]|jgi:glyoxylase I family protein|nr:VOC family protein [Polyangiaceae bacterium]